jgi:uncharacterized membrane protein YqjE
MSGLLGFIRRIGEALVTGAQGSLDLWADELHAEKLRLIRLVIWAGATVFSGAMAVFLATLLVICLFPPHARVGALAALSGIYLAICLGLAAGLHRRAAKPAQRPVTSGVMFAGQILGAVSRMARGETADPPREAEKN